MIQFSGILGGSGERERIRHNTIQPCAKEQTTRAKEAGGGAGGGVCGAVRIEIGDGSSGGSSGGADSTTQHHCGSR